MGDGPRSNRPDEAEKVAACRRIIHRVDWPCKVLTNYSEANLGCKARVSSGLDWVFEQVPEAIILEDDCLPNPTFFRFCQELLERYRDDERIGMISGDNYLFHDIEISNSYYFTKYSNIWGWASWRRAWKEYDVMMRHWPEFFQSRGFENFNMTRSEVAFWTDVFSKTFQNEVDTWDYQWVFTNFINNRASINPAVNLISNIGFGVGATHTTGDSVYANMKTLPMSFPLMHPNFLSIDFVADRLVANESYIKHSLIERVYRKIIRALKKTSK